MEDEKRRGLASMRLSDEKQKKGGNCENLSILGGLCCFFCPLNAFIRISSRPCDAFAAGSLKTALGDVAASYEKTYNTKVTTKFGPSGLLRKAIEGGENPDVFASANMAHPEKLASGGWASPVVLFARNQLCALAQPDVMVTTDNLLDTLLDKNVRVGTSTPKADPSGEYAWELFRKADKIKVRPKAFSTLKCRPRQCR